MRSRSIGYARHLEKHRAGGWRRLAGTLEAITGVLFTPRADPETADSVVVELSLWPVLLGNCLTEVTFRQSATAKQAARLREALIGESSPFAAQFREREDGSACAVLADLLVADEAAAKAIGWRRAASMSTVGFLQSSIRCDLDLRKLSGAFPLDRLMDEFLYRWLSFARRFLSQEQLLEAHFDAALDASTLGLEPSRDFPYNLLRMGVGKNDLARKPLQPQLLQDVLSALRKETTYPRSIKSLIGRARDMADRAKGELRASKSRDFNTSEWNYQCRILLEQCKEERWMESTETARIPIPEPDTIGDLRKPTLIIHPDHSPMTQHQVSAAQPSQKQKAIRLLRMKLQAQIPESHPETTPSQTLSTSHVTSSGSLPQSQDSNFWSHPPSGSLPQSQNLSPPEKMSAASDSVPSQSLEQQVSPPNSAHSAPVGRSGTQEETDAELLQSTPEPFSLPPADSDEWKSLMRRVFGHLYPMPSE